ncbi:hypothetical protein NW762_010075 [Fusarium torreyae]|uniref:DUF3669 domain-containing protein n=1 Tax=Fusarium torreyae TaxID=1237075 RepID=A0A9W8VBZ4_9HYPO|nr:hypothetical protein NW762_010075 [Fusarium torreyae]
MPESGPEPKDQERELHEYALGKRNDIGYYISTNPAEPIYCPKFSIADIFAYIKYDYLLDPSSQSRAWTPRRRPKAEEHQLTKSTPNSDSKIYTTQIGRRKYAVKLGDSPKRMASEFKTQVLVYKKIAIFWDLMTGKDPWGLAKPAVPKPESQIVMRRSCGWGIVSAGFMMECIPPLHIHHARALVDAFLHPCIRGIVKNDPDLTDVRLHVHMGKMAPKHEDLNANLLSRPVYFDQLRRNPTDYYMTDWIAIMACALAILHWGCSIDARGVQFRLGSDKKNHSVLWMTNFGDCRPFAGTSLANGAKAMKENSTWPRPLSAFNLDPESDDGKAVSQMWTLFRNTYLLASRAVLLKVGLEAACDVLPKVFLHKVDMVWLDQATKL